MLLVVVEAVPWREGSAPMWRLLRNLVRAVRASDERGGQAAAEHSRSWVRRPQRVSAFGVPAGTLTFLLTDIEGSARLWANAPTAMPEAIARHYEILDEMIARHGGVRPVEQGEGDGVAAVFTRVS